MRRILPFFFAALVLAGCAAGPGGGSASLPGPGPEIPEIAPGRSLPFGQVAKVCGQSGRALGTPVATAAGFTLRDTDASSTAPRTQYVTGFADGCARQFTAALALFGTPGTREATVYGAGASGGPVDAVYEEVKRQICGVPKGQPCGAAAPRLAANTTFLTAYAAFGASGRHTDLLLHDRRAVAVGVAR
ncbi:lipoprotein [Limimaricola hongkongensis]|uniref:Type IV secretion system putative lipoprotein virB7 n=1 Tax=Limimaricola hongkongensis DSM 17492 TaxID=1122180 RepID=A0A017H8M0_9RHOB|nr:lipoprotein [Limimaricola hongkongensis]EYD70726.1 hypothetical protein Lokhon_02367 [Limimaricola hongkongensis DSM 17492]